MNSETHTPEQTISRFTLALLEDSGWYKINYYIGGNNEIWEKSRL